MIYFRRIPAARVSGEGKCRSAFQQGADPPEDDCLDTKTAGCSIMSSEMGSSESGMDQSEENEDKKAEEDLKNEIYVCCFIGCGYRCREKIL